MKIYCPKCGEYSKSDTSLNTLLPGEDLRASCKGCKTVWRIRIEFFEIEPDDSVEDERQTVEEKQV